MRRSIAVLIAMLCCQLSFCHLLVTTGPKKAWEPGHYFAQSFAHDWKCEVATSRCVVEERESLAEATPIRPGTIGLLVFAIGSACACLLLALGGRRCRRMGVGLVAIAWFGLAQNIAKGTATAATWVITLCPAAIVSVLALRRRPPRIAEASLRVR